jgi:hypothetical protein
MLSDALVKKYSPPEWKTPTWAIAYDTHEWLLAGTAVKLK